MINSHNNTAPSPGQPLQPSLSEGQGGANNLPVGPSDQQMATQTFQQDHAIDNSNASATPVGGRAIDNQIQTLEPYEPNQWHTVDRRRLKKKRRDERNIKQLIEMEKLFEERPYFQSIHTIKFPGVNISEELNLIRADNEIKATCGRLKKITKSGRSTLLVESNSEEQANKLMTLKKIADEIVIVEPHKTLNQIKGVIKSKALNKNTIEELKERLEDQGIVNIQRIKIKKNGEEITTDTYILHFNKLELPKVVKITDWHYEAVQEYNYQPQQCYNCQRFGHVAKYCRRNEKTCVRCGDEGHTRQECPNQISCFHCKEAHYANDKSCNKYKVEKEIISTQNKQKTSKIEATQIVLARMPEADKLYSGAVKTNREDNNQRVPSIVKKPKVTSQGTNTEVETDDKSPETKRTEHL